MRWSLVAIAQPDNRRWDVGSEVVAQLRCHIGDDLAPVLVDSWPWKVKSGQADRHDLHEKCHRPCGYVGGDAATPLEIGDEFGESCDLFCLCLADLLGEAFVAQGSSENRDSIGAGST